MAEVIRVANKNPNILPNVTIGFTILDDCDEKRVSFNIKYIYITFMLL